MKQSCKKFEEIFKYHTDQLHISGVELWHTHFYEMFQAGKEFSLVYALILFLYARKHNYLKL